MAIALANDSQYQGSGETSVSNSRTVPSGSDRCLVVGVHYRGNGGPSAVTWNGTGLTAVDTSQQHGTVLNTSMWYLQNPAATTSSLVVDLAGTANYVIAAFDLTGVLQSGTPHRTATKSSSSVNNPTTAADASSQPGDLIVDLISVRNTAISVSPQDGQTQIYQLTQSSLIAAGATKDAAGSPATSTDVDWTLNTTDNWAQFAAAFIPSVAPVAASRALNRLRRFQHMIVR